MKIRFLVFLLPVLTVIGCHKPAVCEQFIRADEAVDGLYEFALDMSDTLATYDLSFYTAALDAPLSLTVDWSCDYSETVWLPAGKVEALYRSGIRPDGQPGTGAAYPYGRKKEAAAPVILRVRVNNAPEDFRGLGIICKRNDGTR